MVKVAPERRALNAKQANLWHFERNRPREPGRCATNLQRLQAGQAQTGATLNKSDGARGRWRFRSSRKGGRESLGRIVRTITLIESSAAVASRHSRGGWWQTQWFSAVWFKVKGLGHKGQIKGLWWSSAGMSAGLACLFFQLNVSVAM